MIKSFLLAAVSLCIGLAARAEYSRATLDRLDRPFVGDSIALSPDGRRIAYTSYESGRLSLTISDLESHTRRTATLVEDTSTRRVPSKLTVLKWLSPRRLLFETDTGGLFTCDENGLGANRLWDERNTGLVHDMHFLDHGDGAYLVLPGVPRLIGTNLNSPEEIFVESVANIGPESFSNLFGIDAATGNQRLANDDLYRAWQIALYGRGDMILWPPLSLDGIRILDQRHDLDGVGAKAPELNKMTREQIRYHAGGNLMPEQGGAVSQDSSSSGRMIYDRDGMPRILYALRPGRQERPFLVTQGTDVFTPNIPPPSMDKWLGHPLAKEFVVSAKNFFDERSFPLAFDYDPQVLYYASNVGRDTYGIFRLNMMTRARDAVPVGDAPYDLASLEPSSPDSNLVFDDARKKLAGIRVTAVEPRTIWFDEEMAGVQQQVDRAFPRHVAEIIDWVPDRSLVLLRVSADDDPGAFFLLHRATGEIEQFLNRSAGITPQDVNPSNAFSFETPGGVQLSGYITLPNHPKISPPPLVIYCQGGLWDRASPGFNRETQMLADMGLAVIRLNYRGTAGFGRSHLMAITEGVDSVPLADMLATVDWMAGRYKFNRQRVMVMGEGFGGYLALRAMELRPDVFKCAISINAPTSLGAWSTLDRVNAPPMYRDGSMEIGQLIDFDSDVRSKFMERMKRGGDQPVVVEGDFKKPVLVIEDDSSGNVTPLATALGMLGIGMGGSYVEHLSIRGGFVNGPPETRARIFARIEEFLNLQLYEFGSDIKNLRTKGK